MLLGTLSDNNTFGNAQFVRVVATGDVTVTVKIQMTHN